MHRAVISSWPLFFGLAMIMVGNGLQGSLLGLRAGIEGFDTTTTGLIMSLYYAGFLAGSLYAPKLVAAVGHIRVFAGLASFASATVLLHGIFSDAWIWGLTRILTGFSYAGLFIVIESWLNNIATNKIRGQILALYLFIAHAGMVIGQLLLNVADPQEIELFILTSILISMALLPIALSKRPAPEFNEPETVSLRRLYIMSPLGMAGSFFSGICNAVMFSLGAVYASQNGMSIAQISTFMACFIAGGVLFQLPIGWLSDIYDRRKTMIIVCILTAFAGIGCFFAGMSPNLTLYIAMLVFGGFSLSIYGLSIAHTNDHLNEQQILAASSSLVLVHGAGASLGPIMISAIMAIFTNNAFFITLAIIYGLISIFGFWRVQMRDPVPLEDQGDYVSMPARSTPMVMQIVEEDSPQNIHDTETTKSST